MRAAQPDSGTRPTTQWLIRFGALCIALLIFRAVQPDPPSDLAFAIGQYVVWALVLFAVVLLCSPQARERRGAVFAALFVSLLGGNFIAVGLERRQGLQLLDELQRTSATYSNQVLETEVAGRPIAIQPATATTPGDLGTAEVLTKQFANEFAEARNAYLAELDTIRFDKLLDPQRLRADKDWQQSRATIKDAHRVVMKYRQHSLDLLDQMPAKVTAAPFQKAAMRASMLRGIESSLPKSRQDTVEVWSYELQIVDHMSQVIDFLAYHRGRYEIGDTQILFRQDDDLKRFNLHMQAITNLASRQQEVQKRMQREGAAQLEQARTF